MHHRLPQQFADMNGIAILGSCSRNEPRGKFPAVYNFRERLKIRAEIALLILTSVSCVQRTAAGAMIFRQEGCVLVLIQKAQKEDLEEILYREYNSIEE